MVIGMRSMSRSHPFSCSAGLMTPALDGSVSSMVTLSESMLLRMSSMGNAWKPMCMFMPSYWHGTVSSAEVEKSMSCDESTILLFSMLNLIRSLDAANSDTLLNAPMMSCFSTVMMLGLFCGMTAL